MKVVDSLSWNIDLIGSISNSSSTGLSGGYLRFLFWPCSGKSVLCLSREKSIHTCIYHLSSPHSRTSPLEWEMYIASFMLLTWAKISTNGLPEEQNILSARIWFMFNSVLRMLPLCDIIWYDMLTYVGELTIVSFPSSKLTDIAKLLIWNYFVTLV